MYSNLLYSLVEPILEKFKFDFNSDAPLDEQELEGNKRLHKYCLERLEAAKDDREARVEEAKAVYQEVSHSFVQTYYFPLNIAQFNTCLSYAQ